MKDKELFVCEFVVKDFQFILDILGGSGERERVDVLIKRISVVSDQFFERVLRLVVSLKINSCFLIIFGIGDILKVIIMIVNSGFVRVVNNQGVKFSVFIYQFRVFIESKEVFVVFLLKDFIDDSAY